jgi:tRNA pseudouridine55 synthase
VTASGLVVVDKPGGMTSHDVVSRVRRPGGTRKVGHAGTLDPMATGVLVLGVERATRLLGAPDADREGVRRHGAASASRPRPTTPRVDVTATVSTAVLDEPSVRDAAAAFVGELEQVAAAVSAIKVDGRRAYARVRAGEEVELAPRSVTVHELVVHRQYGFGDDVVDVDLGVRCSRGTVQSAPSPATWARLWASAVISPALAAARPSVRTDLAVASHVGRSRRGFRRAAPQPRQRAPASGPSSSPTEPGGGRPGRPRSSTSTAGLTAVFGPGGGEFLALVTRAARRPSPGRCRLRLSDPPIVFRPCRSGGATGDVPADLGRSVVVIGNFDGVPSRASSGDRPGARDSRTRAVSRSWPSDLRTAPDGGCCAPTTRDHG